MSKTKELALGGDFAPITREIGYLKICVEDAARCLGNWRDEILHPSPEIVRDFAENMGLELTNRTNTSISETSLIGQFDGMVRALLPLTKMEKRREVLSQCSGDWSSYLDNGHKGTECASAIGHLCTLLKCDGVRVAAECGSGKELAHWTNLHIDYFVPEQTDWLNVKYTAEITRKSDSVCHLAVTGDPPQALQELEDSDFDQSLRVMLEELGRIGLDPLSKDFHCRDGKFWLIEANGATLSGEEEIRPPWA